MSIKEQITEWQQAVKSEFCISQKEEDRIDDDLEMVLFAIDNMTKGQS